jgi:hypothetical protein
VAVDPAYLVDHFERKLDRLLAIDDLDERQLRELVREQ